MVCEAYSVFARSGFTNALDDRERIVRACGSTHSRKELVGRELFGMFTNRHEIGPAQP
jgi:hypothetical protein